jgi:hypothetical protein
VDHFALTASADANFALRLTKFHGHEGVVDWLQNLESLPVSAQPSPAGLWRWCRLKWPTFWTSPPPALTADDARAIDNHALRLAEQTGHTGVVN